MLRSLLSSPFFTLKPTQTPHFRFSTLSSFNLSRKYSGPIRRAGSMSDVLEIVGPLDQIFTASDADHCLGFLRKCIRSKNFFTGGLIHSHLIKSGLKYEILVSNVMLFVYAKARFLSSCIKVFDEMPERDLISWCTLISGYIAVGFEMEAFGLFKRMMESRLKANQFVVSSVLKGCSASGIIELGLMIHGLAIKSGLGFDRFVEIGLVDMYAKCGDLDDALKMFYEIPVKSSFSWNAMISGYVQNGFLIESVCICQEMCRAGVTMDLVTLRVVASAAASLEMLEFCKNLHAYSIKIGFDTDTFVVAEFVRLLSKLGEVVYMGDLFKKVKRPDVSLYSLLISGYHLHGHRVEAVKLAKELLALGLNPKQGALVNVLNLCICKEEGMQIHAHILKTDHLSCLSVGNAVIFMYIKFGEMLDAKTFFLGMTVHDVVSWTTIMAGLVQNLQFGEALDTFHALRRTGIRLDQHALATSVNACTGIQAIGIGQQVHASGMKLGLEFSSYMSASLVHMYSKCGYIDNAVRFFSCISSSHDLVLMNVMIAGYCWNSLPCKALELFSKEYQVGLVPDQFSFSTVIGACADIRSLEFGEQIHCRGVKSGFDISDVIVGNAVVSMYIKCRSMASASKAFCSMQRRNLHSYQLLMMGYIHNNERSEALSLFYQMQQSGCHANPVIFARILGGCTDLAAIDLGKQIHASIIKMGLVSDAYIGNALLGMYATTRNMHTSFEASNDMPIEDDTQDVSKSTVEDSGLFKLVEDEENCFIYPPVTNMIPIASYQMCGMPHLRHEAQSGLKLELLGGTSLLDTHNCMFFEVSHGTLGEILEREGGLVYSLFKHAPVKYAVRQVEGITPEHVVLLLVFYDVSKVVLLNETYSLNSLQISGIDCEQRSSAWA